MLFVCRLFYFFHAVRVTCLNQNQQQHHYHHPPTHPHQHKLQVKAEPYEGEMVILKRPSPKQQQHQPQQACPFAGEHVRLPLMAAQVRWMDGLACVCVCA